jgi:hypothetical protein
MMYVYPFKNANHDLRCQVWQKAVNDPDNGNKDLMRDVCGMWMRWPEHAHRESAFGWEIDRIKPKAAGGSDDLSNLQPLNWRNNAAKGDTYPWSCPKWGAVN